MNNAVRRLIAGILGAVVAFSSVLIPGQAIALPVVAAYQISVGLHAAAAAAVAWWMADDKPVSEAMSQPGLMVTIAKPSDGGAVEGSVRVPGTSASGSTVPVPTAPPSAPVIPAPFTAAEYYENLCNWTPPDGSYGTMTTRCTECFTSYLPNATDGRRCTAVGMSNGSPTTSIPISTAFDKQTSTPALNPDAGCGPGYTYSGGACNLANPRAVVDDKKLDVTRSGTTNTLDAADLKGAVNAVLSTKYVSNDTTQVSGWSASNQPRLIQVTALSSGGSEVTQYTQKEDGAGGSYLEKRVLTVAPGGVVTTASQTAVAGTLNQSPSATTATGPGYTLTGGTASYTPSAPGSGSGTGSTTGTGSSFPSDYSRQGEASTAAASIVNKLDEKLGSGADPSDPIQPAESEFDQAFFNGTFSSLLGWQLPAHSSQCPTSSFSFNSTSYTVDSHCQLVTNHFSALSAVMSAVWTVLALFILLGA